MATMCLFFADSDPPAKAIPKRNRWKFSASSCRKETELEVAVFWPWTLGGPLFPLPLLHQPDIYSTLWHQLRRTWKSFNFSIVRRIKLVLELFCPTTRVSGCETLPVESWNNSDRSGV
jgi:hypothetical protein